MLFRSSYCFGYFINAIYARGFVVATNIFKENRKDSIVCFNVFPDAIAA